jgi:hypothetical protein
MIFDAWRKRRSVVKQIVQPLGCFSDSELELDGSLIRFPNNKPGCLERCACGAAIELKRCSNEVQMVVDALRPPPKKGTAEPQEKPETSNRRRALKEVLAQDSGKFPRKYCRAIGDAYFCVMAPNGAVLLTTNAVDFEPMAKVLNKTVVTP